MGPESGAVRWVLCVCMLVCGVQMAPTALTIHHNRRFDSGSELTCRKGSSPLNSSVVYLVDGDTATQPVNGGVLRGLTQEQEGTYTCEYNDQFSNNITLAAKPSPGFLKQKNKHVLLNDETDIKLVQLNCDIRPGRLRQNYEIMWKRIIQTGPSEGGFLHITEGINQSDFSLTLNVTKTTPIGAYQCSVRIMHTVAVTDTYLGASISLKTAIRASVSDLSNITVSSGESAVFNCSARGSNVTIEWMVDQVKVASESQSSDAPCFSMTTRSGDSHLVQSRLNCWNTSSLTCSYRIQCTVSQNVDLDFKVEISRTAYLFVEPDINECLIDLCSSNATCENTKGSYVCTCNTGYTGDGLNCTNKDECVLGIDKCNPDRANCTDTEGSYTCHCMAGFSGDGVNCFDIDECSSGKDNCSQKCTNTIGSYQCSCYEGYQDQGTGRVCTDINECLIDPCSSNATCKNTNGSYVCSCNTGYTGDGLNCTNIDECVLGIERCNPDRASCTDTEGSYTCHCMDGFSGDGVNCEVEEIPMTTTTIIVIIIVIIIIVIVILLSTCLTIFTIWCIRRTRKKKQDQRIEEIEMPNISDFKEFENSMIPRNSIRLLNFIGEGEFAVVYKAHLVKNISTSPLQSRTVTDTVAVKTLKGFHDKDSMTALLEEALRMKNLDHPNILTLIGICTDNSSSDSYIVLPYMSNGSLRTHLIRERKSLVLGKDNPQELVNITTRRLMVWCLQVAEGMKYLAAKGLVHRDLAARNCMLGENLVIKIADFGFSEKLYTKLYVRMVVNGGVKLPVKWMAPESLLHGIFSEKSDVWSFGVTCWEIFTGGVTPYPGVHASAIPRMRNHERMMEKPDNTACSEEMYSVMLDCWEAEATDRPSFSYLVRDITVEVEKIAGGYLEIIV